MSLSDGAPTASLLEKIDDDVACILSQSWTATLSFRGFLCQRTAMVPPHEYLIEDQDLFELTKRTWKGWILRFDPITYPVIPGGFIKNDNIYKSLVNDFMTASLQNHHCTLTSNGWRGDKDKRHIACTNLRRYRTSKVPKASGVLRKSSLTCDNINSRGRNGQCMAKRTSTACPTSNGTTCRVGFVVSIDNDSLFMICGNGHNVHSGHPPLSSGEITTRKRLIPLDDANTFQEMDDQSITFPTSTGDDKSFDDDEMMDHNNGPSDQYAKFHPMFNEVLLLLDGVNDEMETKIQSSFQGMITSLKEFHAAKLPQPKGKIVSCMPQNQRAKSQHKKQKKHH